ncbi:methyltransferase domain-containing protein [Streptomyces paromomycinus]|uniref:Methyltransferase n=1 Tax=Streptomyces paromomycinus TaxID=92743 RepID=A0A401WF51_STREY|nr:methyltransferase domain-containing protein [Streptomyces paromomycinus]GCD47963.1 methyltransferase [Streptomyces paromomycinus]
MDVSERYRAAWESYWRDTSDAPGAAIFDCAAELAAGHHLPLLAPFADVTLPVVDLGCGTGTQTRHLARHFPLAVGVDLAEAAVAHARRADTEGAARFEQLDATDQDAVRRLHQRLGDANVYLRAVIHQSEPDARPAIATLIGDRGRAFVVELLAGAKDVLSQAAQGADGPPPKLAGIFAHGLTPAATEDAAVPGFFRDLGVPVLDHGEIDLVMTEHRADGVRIDLPAQWMVLGR